MSVVNLFFECGPSTPEGRHMRPVMTAGSLKIKEHLQLRGLKTMLSDKGRQVLLDVRDPVEYGPERQVFQYGDLTGPDGTNEYILTVAGDELLALRRNYKLPGSTQWGFDRLLLKWTQSQENWLVFAEFNSADMSVHRSASNYGVDIIGNVSWDRTQLVSRAAEEYVARMATEFCSLFNNNRLEYGDIFVEGTIK
jgi:hypothetical protein